MRIKSAKYLVLTAAIALLLGLSVPAQAELLSVSGSPAPVLQNGDPTQVTVDPNNGFPLWYQDTNGLSLGLCTDQNGMCLTEEPNPAAPISFPDNFGPEAFWWLGETIIDDVFGIVGAQALLVLALEAAFANENPIEGDQVAFARIRIRVDVPEPGTYTVTHPFGSATFEVPDAVPPDVFDGTRAINVTQDIGNFLLPGRPGAPNNGDYLVALRDDPAQAGLVNADGRSIGPFLTRADGQFVTDPITGNLYISNPATPTQVTGSPLGNNFFRIVGPPGTAETDLFILMGKVFALAAVASPTPPVNFTRDATGAGTLDFEIPAPAGATTAEVVGVALPLPGVQPFNLTLTAGVFTGSIPIAAVDILPASVDVTFNLGLAGETIQTLPLTDKIVGFTAGVAAGDPTFVENAAGGFTISAASSNQWDQGAVDGSLMPTLNVTDTATSAVLGTIPGSGGALDIAAPGPAQVTITSVAAVGAVDPAGGSIILNNPGIAPPPPVVGGGGGGGGGGCFINSLFE